MKKNLLWMAAAILTSGLAFTACSTNDFPVEPLPVDPEDTWDKAETVFNFEDGNAVFTATSRMSVEIQDNADKESKVLALKNAGNTQNGYGFSYYNFADKVQKPTKITVKFDYFNGGGRGCMTIGDGVVRGTNGANAGFARYTYGKKGAIFAVGATSDGKNYFVNDDILGTAADWCNKWLTVEVDIYTILREVEWKIFDGEEIVAQSGITEGEGEEAVFTPGRVGYWQEDADECTQIDCFGYVNNNVSYIDNLSITNAQDPAIKYADDVKIMYVDYEGNELKESKVISGRVGSIVKLAGVDKAAIYTADNSKKYLYAYDNTQFNPIAQKGTVIKVVFRQAEICYAVLNCMAGGIQLNRFFDTQKYWFFEGDNLTIHPARCYGKDGVYYTTPATTWNGTQFTFPGTITPTVSNGRILYTGIQNYEVDESIVYFANFEDLALPTVDAGDGTGLGQLVGTVNNWYNFTNGLWERLDGGRGIRLDADSYVWTEPITVAGTYTVTIYGRNDAGDAADVPYELGLRDAEGNITWFDGLTIPSWGGAVTGTSVIEGVSIPAGSSLVVKNPVASNLITLDDITVSKPAAE
ncbi:MAG: hypothetical protein IKY01_13955 [Prevotella sp.]|nr:hypothetical protein [Prevotella sp.]